MFSSRAAKGRRSGWSAQAVLLLALSGAGCDDVDLGEVPQAVALCEPPDAQSLIPKARMLPGRVCQSCHTAGGQAGDQVWTAAGTVFRTETSPCNTGGVDGVMVEILDQFDRVLITLTTNKAGNFYTSEARDFSLTRARISKDGKVREMQGLQPTTACATCHFPGGIAPGRIALD